MDNPFLELLQQLMERYQESCDDCDEGELVEVADLTPSEMEEYRANKARGKVLLDEQKRFKREIEMLTTRRKLFWLKLEDRINKTDARLLIKNDKVYERICDKDDE